MKRCLLSDEQIEWLRSVRNSGMSTAEKAKHLGVTVRYVAVVQSRLGIRRDMAVTTYRNGRLVTLRPGTVANYWSRQMLDDLRRHYSTTRNADLAGMLGVSPRSVARKAHELGLKKNSSWLRSINDENRLLAHVASKKKGYPGAFRKGTHPNSEGEFKPGHQSVNSICCVQLTLDGAEIRRFASIRQAALAVGLDPVSISSACRRGGTSAGYRWKIA